MWTPQGSKLTERMSRTCDLVSVYLKDDGTNTQRRRLNSTFASGLLHAVALQSIFLLGDVAGNDLMLNWRQPATLQ